MSIHTFLLDLPEILEGMGLNVWVADGYELGQGNYLWTNPHTNRGSYDEKPWAYMVHHSGSPSATPPPHDTSKASAWIGLRRGDRLYQEDGGIPTIYLASAGPARVSSGYGYRPAAWDYTFEEERAPARAQGGDGSTALNRYSFNMETVHRGDGSALDKGVWQHVVGLGIALEQMCGLKEMTLGHRSWSQRKIDPRWQVGLPNDGDDCIIDVQDAVAAGNMNPPEEEDMLRKGDSGLNVKKWQAYLNRWVEAYNLTREPLVEDGIFGDGTEARTIDFQSWADVEQTGTVGYFDTGTMAVAIGPDTDAP